LPVLGLFLLISVVIHVAQIGFLFLPDRALPDIARLDPLRGLSRLFALANLVRLIFGIFKILIIAAVAYACLYGHQNQVLSLTGLDVPQLARFMWEINLWTCIKVGIALLVLAILDYAFQRWKYEQDLRMTPQEVREEMRNLQGDPQVIARRRSIQRQLAMHRMSAAVPKADVVITNPTELAVAIQYEAETMNAPIVVAKGAGVVAQRIRKLALESGVPIVEKKPLAQALYKEVELNRPIPDKLFAGVAEVLAYVYQLKKKPLPRAG
jgi:flagellar biosynthetic protein FlhB